MIDSRYLEIIEKRLTEICSNENEDVKIAIYPYGEVGKKVETLLAETFKKTPNIIVDSYLSDTNNSVLKPDNVKTPEDYYWIISTYVKPYYYSIKNELLKMGVDDKALVDVCGVEDENDQILRKRRSLKDIFEKRVSNIRNNGNGKIRFGVYLAYSEEFGAYGLIDLMLHNKGRWDVKFVIVPTILRGEDHEKKEYNKTKDFVRNIYGDELVMDGYDYETKKVIDLSDQFDIVYCDNCYDIDVYYFHSIEYLSEKTLPIYISYGYDVSNYYNILRLTGKELNYVWKCFVDTKYAYKDFCELQVIKGENAVVSGYAKMDRLATKRSADSGEKRKRILIATHHTVDDNNLPLSNFLRYSDYFLGLPERFPDIEFIFRPHPILFVTLVNHEIWTEKKVREYLMELKNKGIAYSDEGDYLHLFQECDAIINDCGSFTIEWLYTGKPGCFMKNPKLKASMLTELMNKAINQYAVAGDEEDITNFIRMIESGEYKEEIDEWVKTDIMINYPRVSDFIMKEIDVL